MRIKKRTLKIAVFFIVLALFLLWLYKNSNKDPYSFNVDKFSYSENRGKTEYQISLRSENSTYSIYDINFKSKNFLQYPATIYGLLVVPNAKTNVPGIVLLPGGGVSKESELSIAALIAEMGYAVFTIDQRGIGQTGGYYLNFEQDYDIFSQGKEPTQHLSVYDILKSYDVLRKMEGVDKNNIALIGESMGGRYALIAAAIDKRLKGVIGISTSGFHVAVDQSKPYNNYFMSVDPDNYVSDISPNRLVMIHSENDTMVNIADARITFDLAKEPKKFYAVTDCGHGYCEKMHDDLKEALKIMFDR